MTIDTRARKVTRIVDPKIYSLDAVFGAAYVFLGRAWVHLDRDRKGNLVVTLKAKGAASRDELGRLSDDFENELVDQVVRISLAKKHVKLREMIVGRAMFGAIGVGAERTGVGDEEGDYLDDPLGIAVPWEGRFIGAKKKPSDDSEADEVEPMAPTSSAPAEPPVAIASGETEGSE